MDKEKTTDDRKRLQLTVPIELDAVLDRLAAAYKKPKSTIVIDILNDAVPALKKIATLSEKMAEMQYGVAKLFKGKLRVSR